MNKILNYALFLGFFLASIMIIIVFTSVYHIFALEYTTYKSNALGIEFEYPLEWKLDNEDDDQIILTDPNDSSKMITITKDPFNKGKGEHDLQSSTNEILKITKEYPTIEIIQKPVSISTDNLEMQTFLITDEDEDNNNEINPFQYWTFIGHGYEYEIIFEQTSLSRFNNPENTDLLDHFIKAIKLSEKNINKN
jgi:hypothetical protein